MKKPNKLKNVEYCVHTLFYLEKGDMRKLYLSKSAHVLGCNGMLLAIC